MAFNATLPSAIRKTVADILKISEKYISMPVISPTRRVLLSGMYVSYDLNLISTRTPESFKVALMESVTTGGFVQVLHANSGVFVERTYDLRFFDFSPTFAPTSNLVSTLSSPAGKERIISSKIIPFQWLIDMLITPMFLLYDCLSK